MANIRRNKLKQRNNGLFKSVMVVENDPEGTVESIEVLLPPQNDSEAVPEVFTLEKRKENAQGNTRYAFRHITMEGADPNGKIYTMTAQLKDASGTTIATEEVSATAQDKDGINLTGVSLRLNDDGETFSMRVVIKGSEKNTVASVNVMLTPDDGGSEADPDQFDLNLISENEKKRVYKNEEVTFIEPDNVVDMEYIAAVSIADSNGEELDYAEFRITGQE